jgi:hypothetical protein
MTTTWDHRPERASKRYVQGAEAAWFDALDRLGVDGLRLYFHELGADLVTAGRLAWFVLDHRDHREDGLAVNTRTNYRRDLAQLSHVGPPARPRPERPIRVVRELAA